MSKFCDNFQPIVALHSSILNELTKINIDNNSNNEAIKSILQVLVDHAQGFKLYFFNYCIDIVLIYKNMILLLKKLMNYQVKNNIKHYLKMLKKNLKKD